MSKDPAATDGGTLADTNLENRLLAESFRNRGSIRKTVSMLGFTSNEFIWLSRVKALDSSLTFDCQFCQWCNKELVHSMIRSNLNIVNV